MMNIKETIRIALKKAITENYPMGAKYDKNAPWNKTDDVRQGKSPQNTIFDLIWSNNEFAVLKDKKGTQYVMYLDALNKEDLEPYADIKRTHTGNDDGIPDFDYDDWSINGDVIQRYVNDNIKSIKVGKGIDAYESNRYDLILLDPAMKKYMMSYAKHITNKKDRENFIKILSIN